MSERQVALLKLRTAMRIRRLGAPNVRHAVTIPSKPTDAENTASRVRIPRELYMELMREGLVDNWPAELTAKGAKEIEEL